MKFFKENSYEILRLFLNQVVLAVFGLVLTLATRMASDGSFGWPSLLAGIFAALFYLYILYATLLEIGMKHKVKIDGERMQCDRLWGLKASLFAAVPNFFLVFLLFLGWLFAFVVGGGATAFGLNLFTIVHFILYFFESMYVGIIGFLIPSSDPGMMNCLLIAVSFFIAVLPQILVCAGSYLLGLKNKKLFFGRAPTSDRH